MSEPFHSSRNPRRLTGSTLRVEESKRCPCNQTKVFQTERLERTCWRCFFYPAINTLNQLMCRKLRDLSGSSMLLLSFGIAFWSICKLFHLRKVIFFYTYKFCFIFHFLQIISPHIWFVLWRFTEHVKVSITIPTLL